MKHDHTRPFVELLDGDRRIQDLQESERAAYREAARRWIAGGKAQDRRGPNRGRRREDYIEDWKDNR